MENNKILILKSFDNDFECFFSKNMKKKNVDVMQALRSNNYFLLKIFKIFQKIDFIIPIYHFAFGKWWKQLDIYTYIIIFDFGSNIEIIRNINKANKKIFLWNWNVRNSALLEYRKYCEIVSFDKMNCLKYNWKFNEQFYFEITHSFAKMEKKVFFIGEDKGRFEKLEVIAEILKRKNISFNFCVRTNNGHYEKHDNIQFLNKMLPYSDVIDNVIKSSCILDIPQGGQEGVTLRVLEALFYNRKLITTNVSLSNYDFYNRNNIFIIGVDSYDYLNDFFDSPYISIPQNIIANYSYESWLERMLEL